VSTEVLRQLSDPARLCRILRLESAALATIEADWDAHGLRQVLDLVVDGRGRLRLHDGHHRVIVAGRLGVTRLPVTITRADAIPGWARPVAEVLELLLADLD
jgi:hypothetical protein